MGPEEPSDYVFMGFGPFGKTEARPLRGGPHFGSKKKRYQATNRRTGPAENRRTEGNIIPSRGAITTTRNYGGTAKDKSDEAAQTYASRRGFP